MRNTTILAVLFLLAQNCYADIYECNGVVTNKPCDDGKVIAKEKPYEAPDPQKVDKQKRINWMQNLDTARAKAKSKYDLDVNIDTVRDVCATAPLESCRDAVSAKEREINELITARISADAAKNKEEATPVPQNKITINIIDDSDDALIGQPFGRTPKPESDHNKPNPYDGMPNKAPNPINIEKRPMNSRVPR